MEEQAQQMISLITFAFVLGVMLAGAVAHWWKKKLRREIRGNLISYLFADSPGASAITGGTILGAAFITASTGAADVADPRLLWEMALATGSMPAHSFVTIGTMFFTGWGLDSGFNKGGDGK